MLIKSIIMAIGILIGIVVNTFVKGDLRFKNEIDPVYVVNIIITLMAAVYIHQVIARKNENSKIDYSSKFDFISFFLQNNAIKFKRIRICK